MDAGERSRRGLEDLAADLRRRFAAASSPAALDLAIDGACLMVRLVRSDEVVVESERQALARALVERLELGRDAAEEVTRRLLALDEADLPPADELLAGVAAHDAEGRRRVVEGLLTIASADGVVHRKELALIRRLAEAMDLADADFQEALAQYDTQSAAAGISVPLGSTEITIGRKPDNVIQLPSLSVSGHHARFVPVDGHWIVEDLGSRMGTRVNGQPVRRRRLRPEDLVQVENFRLRLDAAAGRLSLWDENDLLALSVEDLSVRIPNRRAEAAREVLRSISFTCFSGELVAVTGPSGSGKTTLIHALLGTVAGIGGRVVINGELCSNLIERYSRRLALVPQDDIVHGELTVEESLLFSGSLRAVPGVSADEVRREVERVLEELALASIRSARIGDPSRRGVSGGERKRVNLGQEMLNPSTELLILDEPTTGLDPHTGVGMFQLLRTLADRGRLVLVVTHRVDQDTLALMDRLLVLGCTGRLAYFGPPRQALDFCGARTVPRLFDLLRNPQVADDLAERFERSHLRAPTPDADLLPATRESDGPAQPRAVVTPDDAIERPVIGQRVRSRWQRVRQAGREAALQTLRYARIKSRDRIAVAINFGQIPLIVVGCWIVLEESLVREAAGGAQLVVPAALPFVLVISAFWLGCVNSVRELVAERTIHQRERMGGVGVGPYLLSKITVLATVVALQSVLLVGSTELLFHLQERHVVLGRVLLVVFLVGLVGVGLGLVVSALCRTPEAAVAVLPALVVPQLLFGGVLVPFDRMPEGVEQVSFLMASRWGIDGLVQSGDVGIGPGGQPDPGQCTRFAIPGMDEAHCLLWFLEDIGLARQTGAKTGLVAEFSFSQIVGGLAALAAFACAVPYPLLRRKPWGRSS